MSESRLRIKLPNGAELEAAGAAEFVKTERELFLAAQRETLEKSREDAPRGVEPRWDMVIEAKGQQIQLRAKLKGERRDKDACLILLAAAHKLLQQAKPTAGQIARWLRASGYPVQRVDRAIAHGVAAGELLASGSRRARRYELTGPGRVKAWILASQLEQTITG